MFPSQWTDSTHCSLAVMPWRAYAWSVFMLLVASVLARQLLEALASVIALPKQQNWSSRMLQGMSPVSSANSVRTVKVLALGCSNNPQLNAVLDVLSFTHTIGRLSKMNISMTHYIQLNAFRTV